MPAQRHDISLPPLLVSKHAVDLVKLVFRAFIAAVLMASFVEFGAIVSTASAEQAVPRHILILDDSGGAAAGPFYRDIVSALRGSVNRDPSKQYSIYVEHLDLHRFRGPEYELGLKNFFATKYKDRPLGVIVAVGVGALQYVLRSRAELWPAVPVVFTFVDPQLLSALPADVTGTTFRLKLSDMVAAARVVVPDLNQIALVGDPLDTLVPYQHMQNEIPAVTATGMQIIDLTGMPIAGREVARGKPVWSDRDPLPGNVL